MVINHIMLFVFNRVICSAAEGDSHQWIVNLRWNSKRADKASG